LYKIGLFTIASKNYLSYVRLLMNSVQSKLPEYKRYLCLADEIDGYFNPSDENFEVVLSNQLGIDSFDDMTYRYDIMELNTAVKPFMIEWLFKNTDLDIVIYLDPDIQVYSNFTILENEFESGATVLLTPHLTDPVEDDFIPNDYHMLQAGVFNLGFIGLRRSDEVFRFVQWWGRKLKLYCASDVKNNLFTDQKWCDLAPCFIDNLKIIKNPGYNIAYWNMHQRKIFQEKNGNWIVSEKPLVFFHFSGINPEKVELVSKHQNRLSWSDIVSSQPLILNYVKSLINFGWSQSKNWPYAYSQISPSFNLNSLINKFFREREPKQTKIDRKDIYQYIINLCNSKAEDINHLSDYIISNLMLFIYRTRTDLQKIYNLNSLEGQIEFVNWFEYNANLDHNLTNEVVKQVNIQKNNPSLLQNKKREALDDHITRKSSLIKRILRKLLNFYKIKDLL